MDTMIAILIPVLVQVESGGDSNAYNSAENAAGILQIRPIYLQDVNRIIGKEVYSLNERFNPEKSAQMVRIYLTHYGKRYKRITGKPATLEILARIHNGGPDGWKKISTAAYAAKVKSIYEEKKQ